MFSSGYTITFSQCLQPEIVGFKSSIDGNWWILEKELGNKDNAQLLMDNLRLFTGLSGSSQHTAGVSPRSPQQTDGGSSRSTQHTAGGLSMSPHHAAGGSPRSPQDTASGSGLNKLDANCVLKVTNTPKDLVHCGRLFNILHQYGKVTKITVKDDDSSFIEMNDLESAQTALNNLQGLQVFDSQLDLELSSPRAAVNHPAEILLSQDFDQCGEARNFGQSAVSPSKVCFEGSCYVINSALCRCYSFLLPRVYQIKMYDLCFFSVLPQLALCGWRLGQAL